MTERDEVIKELAAYTAHPPVFSENAYFHAKLSFLDALSCAFSALQFPECSRLLGPWTEEDSPIHGARVIGTPYKLNLIQAAFQTGALIRWLDYNDTFLAKEWAHPSDNLGMLLPLFDHLSKKQPHLTLKDLFTALIQTYEIQGSLALKNSFNRFGLDHVFLVKIACSAVAAKLLGGNEEEIASAISQAIVDSGPLRTYRHAPNTGPRKSWAAGDAAARGLFLALLTLRGEKGPSTPLTAPKWGLQDTLLQGNQVELDTPLHSYIIENILYKVSFPAEFHAQTAVETAINLHPQIKDKLDQIAEIKIDTHEAALRIIDKKGPLKNHADRDHCLQYMTAVALLKGNLTAEDYTDQASRNPAIDALRAKMTLIENPAYTTAYHDPSMRAIPNALTLRFNDGSTLGPVECLYPIGHPKRRTEALSLLQEKWERALAPKIINQLQLNKLELMTIFNFFSVIDLN